MPAPPTGRGPPVELSAFAPRARVFYAAAPSTRPALVEANRALGLPPRAPSSARSSPTPEASLEAKGQLSASFKSISERGLSSTEASAVRTVSDNEFASSPSKIPRRSVQIPAAAAAAVYSYVPHLQKSISHPSTPSSSRSQTLGQGSSPLKASAVPAVTVSPPKPSQSTAISSPESPPAAAAASKSPSKPAPATAAAPISPPKTAALEPPAAAADAKDSPPKHVAAFSPPKPSRSVAGAPAAKDPSLKLAAASFSPPKPVAAAAPALEEVGAPAKLKSPPKSSAPASAAASKQPQSSRVLAPSAKSNANAKAPAVGGKENVEPLVSPRTHIRTLETRVESLAVREEEARAVLRVEQKKQARTCEEVVHLTTELSAAPPPAPLPFRDPAQRLEFDPGARRKELQAATYLQLSELHRELSSVTEVKEELHAELDALIAGLHALLAEAGRPAPPHASGPDLLAALRALRDLERAALARGEAALSVERGRCAEILGHLRERDLHLRGTLASLRGSITDRELQLQLTASASIGATCKAPGAPAGPGAAALRSDSMRGVPTHALYQTVAGRGLASGPRASSSGSFASRRSAADNCKPAPRAAAAPSPLPPEPSPLPPRKSSKAAAGARAASCLPRTRILCM